MILVYQRQMKGPATRNVLVTSITLLSLCVPHADDLKRGKCTCLSPTIVSKSETRVGAAHEIKIHAHNTLASGRDLSDLNPSACYSLNQCSLIINWILQNKRQWNLNWNKFRFAIMHLKISSAKYRSFLGFNVLKYQEIYPWLPGVDVADAVTCPIPYGGMLLFSNVLPHRR